MLVLWVLWLFLTRCGAYSLAHWARLLPLPRNASRCEVVARLVVLPLGAPVCWFTMVLGRVSGTCQVVDTRAAESALRETASARRDRLRAEDQAAANAAAVRDRQANAMRRLVVVLDAFEACDADGSGACAESGGEQEHPTRGAHTGCCGQGTSAPMSCWRRASIGTST